MTSEKIKAVHRENYSAYGAKKVYAALNRAGQRVAWCTVERLMRRVRLHGVRREHFASVGACDNAMAEALNSLFEAELVRNKVPWGTTSGFGADIAIGSPAIDRMLV